MKKIFTFLAFIIFTTSVFSQVYLSEDFSSNQVPPQDWTIDGYTAQWAVSGTTNAGGVAPEAKFTYINSVGVTRFISPVVDLTGVSVLTLKFDHYYDDYSGAGPILGVATRSGGGDWTSVWDINPSTDLGPETKFIEITGSDVGASDFQFCIYLDGNMYNLDYYYLDNIQLYTPYNLDAELSGISTPSFIGEPTEVTGMLTNYGLTEITSLGLSWQINDGEVTQTTFDAVSIPTNGTYDFVLDGLIDLPIGGYDLNVWIHSVNGIEDDNDENNSLTKPISVLSHTVAKKPLLEEFTSSTCAPCASFNTTFVPWTEQHEDDIVLVKYQMDWPGVGDPYYTEEGGVRRAFYGVSYVPDLFGNGSRVATSVSAVQSFFDGAINEMAFVSANGTHNIDGTNIEVTANILPFANISNANVYIVVFENVTVNNTGSNGETEFHHVMMKMLPDANGTTIDLVDREPISITESYDMSGTFVEEMNDLGVAIIVQANDGYVYQAVYSMENENYNTEARLDYVEIDGELLPEFDSDVLTYDINLPSNTSIVPEVLGTPMDQNSIVIEIPATELPGASNVDVFAADLLTHQTYVFNFTLGVGVSELSENQVSLYPNPANDIIHLSNIPQNSSIKIKDVSGRTVSEFNSVSGNTTIDTKVLRNGVYFLEITLNSNSIVKKFTVER